MFDFLFSFFSIPKNLELILMKLSDLATTLTGIDNQLTTAKAEILRRLQELQDALTDVPLPPEAEAALSALSDEAAQLDDIVPNAD